MGYDKMNRAESRLSRNLDNVNKTFDRSISLHSALIGGILFLSKEMNTLSPLVLAFILITVGGLLTITCWFSLIAYAIKLKANEKVIGKLETELNDYQQLEEDMANKPFISAGKSRKMQLIGFYIIECLIALYFIYL